MRLGTRGSHLALWQAHAVARAIECAGGPRCEIVVIRTSGDEASTTSDGGRQTAHEERQTGDGGRETETGRWEAGDQERDPALGARFAEPGARSPLSDLDAPPSVKRLFVKELEEALLDGRIDSAVHSAKDMPARSSAQLAIGATLPREDPRDAVIFPSSSPATDAAVPLQDLLGPSSRVGTVSVRRVAQLRLMLRDATFVPIRGNVDTRLRKLDAGECSALVLAAAGLKRLDRADRISRLLPVSASVPAPGQGIVAVEHRIDRTDVGALLARIDDRDASDALAAERAVVRALGGGCQMPIGVFAQVGGEDMQLTGVVIALDGSRIVRHELRGVRSAATSLGLALAEALLAAGADKILDALDAARRV